MNSSDPLVSVLVPAYNAAGTLRRAIESVLSQSGPSVEVLIIDDHSTDSTASIARSFGGNIRVISNATPGISHAMNTGLAAARGKYLARCDADDLYPPGRLAWQFAWLDMHPDFAAVAGRFCSFGPTGMSVEMTTGDSAEEITTELRQGTVRTHLCTYLARTEILRQIGGFRPWFITAEDIDLQLRLSEAGRVWYEPANCYFYRIHDQSITHNVDSRRRVFFDEQSRNFQKQRQTIGADDLQRDTPPSLPPAGDSSVLSAREHAWHLLMHKSWRHWPHNRLGCVKTGLQCCRLAPMRWRSWRNLAALLLKSGNSLSHQ